MTARRKRWRPQAKTYARLAEIHNQRAQEILDRELAKRREKETGPDGVRAKAEEI